MIENAITLACMIAARPVTAAITCGTMPSVQANAATRLARQPRDTPAASVYSTPAPGVATTTSVVSRNSGVISAALAAELPPALERTVRLRLLVATVLVSGAPSGLG